ncbi:MAG: RadC family protein [Thermodesulfobacteriota bacterium]
MIKLPAHENTSPARENRKRLQERFLRGALDGFHSTEILEFLLAYASPRADVKACVRSLVERFGDIRGVFDASIDELSAAGMNENAAILIKLVKDVAGEYLKERMTGKDVIGSPADLLDYLNLTLSGERVEKFLAIYLNSNNEALAIEVLHEGTINQTVVYPRKAIELAFRHNAHSVIFVHNHPSGDAAPSRVDRELAGALDRAAEAVDLIVHDHIIIGRDTHFSARENGWFSGPPSGTAGPDIR